MELFIQRALSWPLTGAGLLTGSVVFALALVLSQSLAAQDPFLDRLRTFEEATAQAQRQPTPSSEAKPKRAPTQTLDEFPDAHDGLNDVNALRAAKGLPPFKWDASLTAGAMNCATRRAKELIAGHSSNDFGCMPVGYTADATGCAAWDEETVRALLWGSCCSDEAWEYAGAAWVRGSDGKRYMCLFVRGSLGVRRSMAPTASPITAAACRT